MSRLVGHHVRELCLLQTSIGVPSLWRTRCTLLPSIGRSRQWQKINVYSNSYACSWIFLAIIHGQISICKVTCSWKARNLELFIFSVWKSIGHFWKFNFSKVYWWNLFLFWSYKFNMAHKNMWLWNVLPIDMLED